MSVEVFVDLAQLMDRQLQILVDLCDLGRKKTALLIANDLTGLEALIKGEQTLIWHLGRLEERRYRQQTLLAGGLGLPEEEVTMGRLVEMSPPEMSRRFVALQDQYGRRVSELAELNQINSDLLRQALTVVNFTIELLAAAHGRTQTYNEAGKRQVPEPVIPARRLDSRA